MRLAQLYCLRSYLNTKGTVNFTVPFIFIHLPQKTISTFIQNGELAENHILAIDNHVTVWYNIITIEHGGVNVYITAVFAKQSSNMRCAAKNGRD